VVLYAIEILLSNTGVGFEKKVKKLVKSY